MRSAITDSDLMNNFSSGNEDAVKEIYDLNYRPLCYFADQLINNTAEAEDIAVESFLKLLKKRADFKNYAEIKSFLFTVVRNACFDFLRKAKVVDRSKMELTYLAPAAESFGEEEMITAKVLQAIYEEIEQLPGQCKIIFKAIYIDNKSTGTIAEEMSLSSQTVLNQKSKALHILREKLSRSGLYSATVFLYCINLLGNKIC
ncbi:MAG: RNA polymerase sigma-70 factor [Ferruginibacter sp.]